MKAIVPLPARPIWLRREVFPFRSRFLDLDGARMHYVDEGHGPPLLLVHGSPMWSFMYRHPIAALKSRFRCIAVDLPGLGRSTATLRRGHAHEDAARLLTQFVRALDLHDAVLAVHATAGPAGLAMAARETARLRGLVISNTFAWPLDDDPRLALFVRLVSSRLFALVNVGLNALAHLTARFGRHNGRFDPAERDAILGPYRERPARRHLQNLLYGVRVERERFAALEQDLGRLAHLPALLLYGAHDNGYRAGFVERWRSLLPEHRLAILEQAGHFPFEDAPDQATDALRRWLDDLDVRDRSTIDALPPGSAGGSIAR